MWSFSFFQWEAFESFREKFFKLSVRSYSSFIEEPFKFPWRSFSIFQREVFQASRGFSSFKHEPLRASNVNLFPVRRFSSFQLEQRQIYFLSFQWTASQASSETLFKLPWEACHYSYEKLFELHFKIFSSLKSDLSSIGKFWQVFFKGFKTCFAKF